MQDLRRFRVVNRRRSGPLAWALRIFVLCAAVGTVAIGSAATAIYVHYSKDLPEILSVSDYRPSLITRFVSNDGRLVGDFSVERRTVVPLDAMPEHILQAFLAAEDKRFFEHDGVDYRATLRAFVANVTAGRTVQGASTMTQQLCKSLVGRQKSLVRKVREAILARRTEQALSKLQILYLYLNEIYLGHGAYGVQAAAQRYFGKDVSELSLSEGSLLAGLPPQPGRLNPVRDMPGSKKRQRYVLDRMVSEGFINSEAAEAAFAAPIELASRDGNAFQGMAPYFTEHARKKIQTKYGYDALNRGGLEVVLTVDVDAQRSAQNALQRGLHEAGDRQGYLGPEAHLDERERANFLTQSEAYYGGQDLANDEWRLGLVIETSRQNATIQVGHQQGRIPLRGGMKWAAPYDYDAKENNQRLRDVRKALTVGDVVWVRKIRGKRYRDAEELVLALGQIPPLQGAVVSMEADTGYVSAMVGGYDFEQSEYNRAFQGCRQPGSIFKPLVYSLALDADFTLATMLDDSPITVFDSKEGYFWKPRNFSGEYRGSVLLRDAFIRSMNIPAIEVIREVGPQRAADWAKSLGISTALYPDQSLVLGASCVYPWDMVRTYGVFASRGKQVRPVFVKRVLDRDGQILEDHTHFGDVWSPFGFRIDGVLRSWAEPSPRRLAESTSYLMQTALRQVVENGTARRARKLERAIGGKTGTTDAYDAWFLGFSGDVVTGVWVGSDRNRRRLGKGETGGKVALPIWMNHMEKVFQRRVPKDFLDAPPQDIEFYDIDRETGLLAVEGAASLSLPFRRGTQPQESAADLTLLEGEDLELIESRF